MKRPISSVTASLVAASLFLAMGAAAQAADYYFDVNGNTAGSGVSDASIYAWDTTSTFWNPQSDGTGPTGGDYNGDGSRDAGDYVLFRKNDGTANTLPDDNGLGSPIGPAHYTLWQSNYGKKALTTWTNGNNAIFAAGTDAGPTATGTGIALNIGAGVSAASATIEEGKWGVNSGTFDTGTGSITVKAGATLAEFGSSGVGKFNSTGKIVLEGGTLLSNITANAGSILSATKGLEVNGVGYIGYDDTDGTPDNKVSIFSGVITGTGGTTTNGGAGTLIKIGPDQIGIGASTVSGHSSQADFTFAKLIVKQGGYRGRNQTFDGTVKETIFGAVPLNTLADAITLDGGGIGSNTTVTLDAKRGITIANSAGNNLGVIAGDATLGGGYFDHNATAGLNIPGPLSGTGSLYIGDPTSSGAQAVTFTLSNANNVNTFSGNLIGVRSTLLLNSSLTVNGLKDVSGFTQNPANNSTITIASGNTLTVGVSNGGGTWSRPIGGAGGSFAKVGTGTETLTAVNTYTGNTSVSGGILSISNAYLADAADVLMFTGGTLNLNFSGDDTIDQLFFNNVSEGPGTYAAIGTGGGTIERSYITGTGHLIVSNAGSGAMHGGSIPEPSAVTLLVLGLSVFGVRRRGR
jgi:fibronectin-binding autotransporter adhesin